MPKAKNLKYLRTKANLTQQDFADEIGVSKATIVSWESRTRAIPAPSSRRIAAYFGLSYEEYCDVDIELLEQSGEHEKVRLTESETKSILMFRKLPNNVKKLIRYAIVVEHENHSKGDTLK